MECCLSIRRVLVAAIFVLICSAVQAQQSDLSGEQIASSLFLSVACFLLLHLPHCVIVVAFRVDKALTLLLSASLLLVIIQ